MSDINPPGSKPKARHARRAALIVGAAIAALFFFLAGAAVRLMLGPISLGPFGSVIEDALNESIPGLVVRFDQAALEWSRDQNKVTLVILGTKVFDREGRIIAQAPKADLDLDAPALFAGKVEIKRLALVGVQLTAIRAVDGTIHLGFSSNLAETDLWKTIRQVLQDSGAKGGSFESFALRHARLAFHDEPTGLFVVSPDTTLTVKQQKTDLQVLLDSGIEISGMPSHITAQLTLNDAGRPRTLNAKLTGFAVASLAKNSAHFAALSPFALTTDLAVDVSFAGDGAIAGIKATADGKGTVVADDGGVLAAVDKTHLEAAYDAKTDHVTIGEWIFGDKGSKGHITGDIGISRDNAGSWSALTVKLDGTKLEINSPAFFSGPLKLNSIAAQGDYTRDSRKLNIGKLTIRGPSFAEDASGTVTLATDKSPAIALHGSIAAIPVRKLLAYWPKGLGEGARQWVTENIKQGVIGPASIAVDIPEGALDKEILPEQALNVRFPLSKAEVQYMPGLTPLTMLEGNGLLTGDTFHADVISANVGELKVSNGMVTVPNLHIPGAPAEIAVHVDGKVADVLGLIDEPPLGYAKRFGIKPSDTRGTASIDVNFVVPTLANVSVDQLRVGVRADAKDLSLPLDEKRRIDGGDAQFTIDGTMLQASGTASMSSVPFHFAWTELFTAPANGITSAMTVQGTFDAAGRKALGLDLSEWIDGPLTATIALKGSRLRFSNAGVNADLTGTVLHPRFIRYAKGAGTAAQLSADLTFPDSGDVEVANLKAKGPDLDVQGSMRFNADGDLIDAQLNPLRAGPNTDMQVKVATEANKKLVIDLQGRSLDASGLFSDSDPQPKKPSTVAQEDKSLHDPVNLSVRLDQLLLRNDVQLKSFVLMADLGADERMNALALSADGPGSGHIKGDITLKDGRRLLTAHGDGAGALIGGLSGFGSLRGGTIDLSVNFPVDTGRVNPPDYAGTLTLKDFVIADQPFMARLFSVGSLDGLTRLLNGEGISITKLNVPFSARKNVLTIEDGRASGPSVGFSLEGSIDRNTDRINISGTLVPLFGLNSMLGAIPLLGDLLVSKQGEGIFGLTYSARGDIDEPSIAVNPLSVLTPGILRRIFEFDSSQPKPKPQVPTPTPAPDAGPTQQAPAQSGDAAQTEKSVAP